MLVLADLKGVEADERTLLIVNAYIKNKGVKITGEVPNAIKQAGVELAQGFIKGELLAGRNEGVVVSKTAKAGEVSTSKTYANGADGRAMGQHEMIALTLIEPYIIKGVPLFVGVGRI